MFWIITAIIAILVGIALVWSVLIKKFPQLKLIDLSSLAKERHREVKTRIIRDRFERSLGTFGARANSMFGGLNGKLGSAFDRALTKLRMLERKVEEEKPLSADALAGRLTTLLHDARSNAGLERYGMAEESYIEILRLDPKHVEAYRGLAEVYIAQKQYEQAKETLEYLTHLHAEDDLAFERLGAVEVALGHLPEAEARFLQSIGLATNPSQVRTELGEAYLAMNEPKKAWEQFRQALLSEPYNPKYLDYFLETSILLGDAGAAEEAFVVLETANPENQKLSDFRSRIDALKEIMPT